jgi:uncharacterized protein YndB with AHSA1/START domain
VIRFAFSIDIDRPAAEVFDYLTDAERLPEWQSGVLEAHWLGEPAEGTHVREVRRFLGRRLEIEQEVTAYEPGRRFGLRSVAGPFPLSADMTLAAEGEGTTLTFAGEAEPGGFFKLAETIVRRTAERQIRGDFETLKDILEARGPA